MNIWQLDFWLGTFLILYVCVWFLLLWFNFVSFNVWKVIAERLTSEELQGLKQMFNNMDTDGSGTITYEELKTGLSRLGSRLTELEIKQLMDAVST